MTSLEQFPGPPALHDVAHLAPLFDRLLAGELAFGLVFQPIVDLRRGVAVGYETLVRFPKEIGLAPDICFRAAAGCNRRLELEEEVIKKSVMAVDKLPPNCFLSINVSPALLLSDRWKNVEASVPTFTRIVFEITEQDPVDDYDTLRALIERVKARGGHVAVDDAGAGYASLKHAMELRPNFLKLDRYFVGECHGSYAKSTLIEMIGKAASRMDAWVVAEGIESVEELDELIRLDVPLGQGYFLGRPAPEMMPLPPERALEIAARTHALAKHRSLSRVVENCSTISAATGRQSWPAMQATSHAVMVLDAHNRPSELLEPHAIHGWQSVMNPMRALINDDVEQVLQRALTRPKHQRFDTLAAVNEVGEFCGIVRVDKMIQAMLYEEPRSPVDDDHRLMMNQKMADA